MRLIALGGHCHLLVTKGGDAVLFSYQTPVAVRKGTHWYQTAERFSSTTLRHVAAHTTAAEKIDPEAFQALLRPLS